MKLFSAPVVWNHSSDKHVCHLSALTRGCSWPCAGRCSGWVQVEVWVWEEGCFSPGVDSQVSKFQSPVQKRHWGLLTLMTAQTEMGKATKTQTQPQTHFTNLFLNETDFLNPKLVSIPASTAGILVGCTLRERGQLWGRSFVGKQDAWLDNCIRRVELVWWEHQQEELQDLNKETESVSESFKCRSDIEMSQWACTRVTAALQRLISVGNRRGTACGWRRAVSTCESLQAHTQEGCEV